MNKISSDTLAMVNRLPKDKRARVDAIVRRHVAACQGMDIPPDSLERVFIEAVELVDIEIAYPEADTKPADTGQYEPFRQYPQYVSPVDSQPARRPADEP